MTTADPSAGAVMAIELIPVAVLALVILLVVWRLHLQAETRRCRVLRNRFESLFENNSDAVATLSNAGVVEALNPAFTRLMGWTDDEVRGTRFSRYVVRADRSAVDSALEAAVTRQDPVRWTLDTALERRTGGRVEVELTTVPIVVDGNTVGVYQLARDISGRKEVERRLETRALHDCLTNLPNRALFQDRLTHALERAARSGNEVALLYVDVDGFKGVNDRFGHAVGDEVLVTIAASLRRAVTNGDTVARLGGDEFAVLLEDLESTDEALMTARRLVERVSSPMPNGEGDIEVGVSVGVTLNSTATKSVAELVRQADVAMYEAKRLGGRRFQLYTPDLEVRPPFDTRQLRRDLAHAIERDELLVFYQPIVEQPAGEIVGVEALVRWAHPELGLILPSDFLPLAEESDMIIELDDWVLRTACRDIRSLVTPGSELFLSVNFSERRLLEPDLPETISSVLNATGLDPERLQLEIKESLAGPGYDHIKRLSAVGIRLAIDGFGTGRDSLDYLGELDIDAIKVHRSFVGTLGQEGGSSAVVRTSLQLAKTLGIQVIVEGIEEHAQLEHFCELGGQFFQGHHFSIPVNFESLKKLLAAGPTPERSGVAEASSLALDPAPTDSANRSFAEPNCAEAASV